MCQSAIATKFCITHMQKVSVAYNKDLFLAYADQLHEQITLLQAVGQLGWHSLCSSCPFLRSLLEGQWFSGVCPSVGDGSPRGPF